MWAAHASTGLLCLGSQRLPSLDASVPRQAWTDPRRQAWPRRRLHRAGALQAPVALAAPPPPGAPECVRAMSSASFASRAPAGYSAGTDSVAQSVFAYSSGAELALASLEDDQPHGSGQRAAKRPRAGTPGDPGDVAPRDPLGLPAAVSGKRLLSLSADEAAEETDARDDALQASLGVVDDVIGPLLTRFHAPALAAVQAACMGRDEGREVPTVVLFAGLNVADHSGLFRHIASRLREDVSPMVVQLRAADCQSANGALALVLAACHARLTREAQRDPPPPSLPSLKDLRAASVAVGAALTAPQRFAGWFAAAFQACSDAARPPPAVVIVVENAEAVPPAVLERFVACLHGLRAPILPRSSAANGPGANGGGVADDAAPAAAASHSSLAARAGLIATQAPQIMARDRPQPASSSAAASAAAAAPQCAPAAWAASVPFRLVLGASTTAAAWQSRLTEATATRLRAVTVRLERPLGVLDAAADALAARGALPRALGARPLAAVLEHALQHSLSASAIAAAARILAVDGASASRLGVLAAPLPRLPADPSTTDGGLRSLLSAVPVVPTNAADGAVAATGSSAGSPGPRQGHPPPAAAAAAAANAASNPSSSLSSSPSLNSAGGGRGGRSTALSAARAAAARSVPPPSAAAADAVSSYARVPEAVLRSALWRACACRVNGLPAAAVASAAALPSVKAERLCLGETRWATVWPSSDADSAGDADEENDWSSSSDDDAATVAHLLAAGQRDLVQGRLVRSRRSRRSGGSAAAESDRARGEAGSETSDEDNDDTDDDDTDDDNDDVNSNGERAAGKTDDVGDDVSEAKAAASGRGTPRRKRARRGILAEVDARVAAGSAQSGSAGPSKGLSSASAEEDWGRGGRSAAGLSRTERLALALAPETRPPAGAVAREGRAAGVLSGLDKVSGRLSRRSRWHISVESGDGQGETECFLESSRAGRVRWSSLMGAARPPAATHPPEMQRPRFVVVERPRVAGRRATLTRWVHAIAARRLAAARVLRCLRICLALAGSGAGASEAVAGAASTADAPTLASLHRRALEAAEEDDEGSASGRGRGWGSIALSSTGRRAAAALSSAPAAAARTALRAAAALLRCDAGAGGATPRDPSESPADGVANSFEPWWEPQGAAAWLEPWAAAADRLASGEADGGAAGSRGATAASASEAAASAVAAAVAGRGTALSKRRAGLAAALATGTSAGATARGGLGWAAAQWLVDLLHCALRPWSSLPAAEAMCSLSAEPVEQALESCPRQAVVVGLRAPGAYLLRREAAEALRVRSMRPRPAQTPHRDGAVGPAAGAAGASGAALVTEPWLPSHPRDLAGVVEQALDGSAASLGSASRLRVAAQGEGDEMPDATAAWRLAEHAGRSIPLSLWFVAFREGFAAGGNGRPYDVLLGPKQARGRRTAESMGASGRKRRGAKRRPKRGGAAVAPEPVAGDSGEEEDDEACADETEISPCELRAGVTEEDVLARFAQAVKDLAHVGAIKLGSNRRADGFAQRVLLEVKAWSGR